MGLLPPSVPSSVLSREPPSFGCKGLGPRGCSPPGVPPGRDAHVGRTVLGRSLQCGRGTPYQTTSPGLDLLGAESVYLDPLSTVGGGAGVGGTPEGAVFSPAGPTKLTSLDLSAYNPGGSSRPEQVADRPRPDCTRQRFRSSFECLRLDVSSILRTTLCHAKFFTLI